LKFLQNLITVTVVVILGGLVYQFARSFSIDSRVLENTRRVDSHEAELKEVGERTLSHDQTLLAHQRLLTQHSERIRENAGEIVRLAERATGMQREIERLEGRGEANEAAIGSLRHELAAVQEEQSRRRDENAQLRKQLEVLEQRDAEVELRLRNIEKMLEVEGLPPALPAEGAPRP
jgi:chromosome segregation ATPase